MLDECIPVDVSRLAREETDSNFAPTAESGTGGPTAAGSAEGVSDPTAVDPAIGGPTATDGPEQAVAEGRRPPLFP